MGRSPRSHREESLTRTRPCASKHPSAQDPKCPLKDPQSERNFLRIPFILVLEYYSTLV